MRDEESWFRSLQGQFDELNREMNVFYGVLGSKFLPVMRNGYQQIKIFGLKVGGKKATSGYFSINLQVDEMLAKQTFRKHNAYVLQEAPKDKLLVYSVKEGWEPLCKFLDKEVPDKPFPRRNVGGKDIVPDSIKHEFGMQMFRELAIALIILFIIFLAMCFYFDQNSSLTNAVLLFSVVMLISLLI